MSKRTAGRLLVGAALVAIAWSILVFATGGLVWETARFRISSRDPFRPLVFGLICAIAAAYLQPAAASNLVARLDDMLARRGAALAVLIAVVVAAIGIRSGTYAASGADSYGYVSQADLWRNGHLRIDQRALDLPPLFDDWSLSPLGYHPAPQPHVIVPTYPPGLPLLMAAAKTAVGPNGCFYIVPLLGALGVLSTYVLGRLLVDSVTGIAAAALFAASPTFQYQLLWPMTDVPAAAAWTVAVVFGVAGWQFAAGLASAAAIVIRPNLAPLGLGVAVIAIGSAASWRDAMRRLALYAAGAAPGAIAIALLNTYLYGGPTVPSYTHLDSLFSWKNFVPNATRYGPWLVETQTPFVALALLPLASRRFALTNSAGERTTVRIGLTAFLVVLALSYVFYQPYDDWWFLRFFLPGLPVLLVLAVGAVRSTGNVIGLTAQRVLTLILVVAVLGWEISTDQWRGIYSVQKAEQRYVTVGRDLARTTPPNAVFLAMQHSGSLRYYSGRLTIRYDALPTGSLDRAVALLRARGFRPYFVLEKWEEAAFRERFAATSDAGKIDWPPARIWPTPTPVAIYDPEERRSGL